MPFNTFPLEGDSIPEGYDGWLILLDELSSASTSVMAAIYNLLLGRTVGNHKLHEKAFIVAAGNKSTDKGIAEILPVTLTTRMLPVEMTVSTTTWIEWAKENNINRNVISYIEKGSNNLYDLPDSLQELEAYPNPRSWEAVSAVMNFYDSGRDNIDYSLLHDKHLGVMRLIVAAVGEITATDFLIHLQDQGRQYVPINIDDLINGKVTVPKKNATHRQLDLNVILDFVRTSKQNKTIIDESFKEHSHMLNFLKKHTPEEQESFKDRYESITISERWKI